jgi:hypothetical protein
MKPPYTITDKILALVASISEKYMFEYSENNLTLILYYKNNNNFY